MEKDNEQFQLKFKEKEIVLKGELPSKYIRKRIINKHRNRISRYRAIVKKVNYIYIVIHPLYPNWVKVGKTMNPNKRLSGFQAYDPERSYKMYFIEQTDKVNRIEKFFKEYVSSNGYEWFNIKKEEAKSIIIKLIKELK